MPTHCKGGMQDQIWMVASKMQSMGNEVTIITTKHPDNITYDERDGVRIHYLKNTEIGKYSKTWWDESVNKFIELHIANKFDIVHSQSSGGYYFLKKKLNELYHVPAVVSLHGTSYDEIKTRINLISVREPVQSLKSLLSIIILVYKYFIYGLPLLDLADGVIVTSNEQVEITRKTYLLKNIIKIYKVFNGIDVKIFKPISRKMREHYALNETYNFILSIARIEKDKGIQNIIAALPIILIELPDTKLMVVGDGSYAPELRKQVKKLKIESNVIFTGMLSFESLPDYFNACDLFVNPTIRQNGYDLTILEAMACEKPVVVSNIGSVPTVIEDGVDGLLVPPGDIKKLAEAVIKVLTDKELAERLGKAARKKIVEKFSIESMVEGTIKVYEEVIRRNKEKSNQN
jgi:glycosyltransferase involved in cell wall biosynthesis